MRLAVRCGGATLEQLLAGSWRWQWRYVCAGRGWWLGERNVGQQLQRWLASNGALCYWSRYLRDSVQLRLRLQL